MIITLTDKGQISSLFVNDLEKLWFWLPLNSMSCVSGTQDKWGFIGINTNKFLRINVMRYSELYQSFSVWNKLVTFSKENLAASFDEPI